MIEFVIDLNMTGKYSLNKIYSGSHWTVRRSEAQTIHDLVKWSMVGQHVPKRILRPPVAVEIAYNCGLDIDNCGYMSKLIIDGLKGWLIEDDNKKHVRQLTQSFWGGKGIRVRIEEVG